MKLLLPGLLLALLGLPSTAFGVIVFEDGGVTDYAGVEPTGAIVRDSLAGSPTTVNLRPGADLGPTDVQGSSILNVFEGSTVDDFDVFDTARIDVSGGSHGTLDLLDDARGTISGATFDGCFPCLRLFANAEALVTGGSFASPSQIVALTQGFAALRIRGGSFTGFVRANDDSRIEILGGAFERVQALDQATVVLYGDGFLAVEGGTTVLAGFGEIVDGFNGTITGELADGSPLSIDALNGVVGSKIVLADGGPFQVPGLSPLARGLLGLGLVGIGGLASQRRGSRRRA
jgi:hypothetical protein